MAATILVSDLDKMTPHYKVVDKDGYSLGEKSRNFGYLKPEYTRQGHRTGGRHAGFDARQYKTAPPWLKYEVTKIDTLGGFLTFHARKRGAEA